MYEDSKDMTESGFAAFPGVNFKSRKWHKKNMIEIGVNFKNR
jgi:hypothetical protein